jgi:hypothetical protein
MVLIPIFLGGVWFIGILFLHFHSERVGGWSEPNETNFI